MILPSQKTCAFLNWQHKSATRNNNKDSKEMQREPRKKQTARKEQT
jgi:hypothetical protein